MERFKWLEETFIPYLQFAEEHLPEHKSLISGCCYVLGDVYDFNEAYLKARESYQRSVDLFPNGPSYRELACMYSHVGEFEKAIFNIEKSLELSPDDKHALEDIENIRECAEENILLAEKDDLVWKCNELLANKDFQTVLELVKNKSQCKYYKIQARSYGAMFSYEKYIKIWRKICDESDTFSLERADWFYMPSSVYNNSTIWELFLEANEKITDTTFPCLDLYEYYPKLSPQKTHEVICKFKIYKLKGNRTQLLELSKNFPLWKTLANLLQ